MDMENYKIKVFCKNCNFGHSSDEDIEIPKGVLIENHPCPNCGNKSLEKKAEKVRLIPRHTNYR